ncbi:MAG: ABC transporter ATP-binding protein, partial [Bacteroidota bacterium]
MLRVSNISKSYKTEKVLAQVDFQLEKGQTLSILGRSGSGKSTLLKLIAGLESPDAGQVEWEGQDLTDVAPQARQMVYLYQSPLLFPHLNVFENLAFGLRIRQKKQPTIRQAVGELLEQIDLQDQAKKFPYQLSGGQQQRVNFGRALIIRPRVLLLDEPFGKLDPETRSQMQILFRNIALETRMTALFVTHDPKEALLMGD